MVLDKPLAYFIGAICSDNIGEFDVENGPRCRFSKLCDGLWSLFNKECHVGSGGDTAHLA
jgi:hypothetical protein